MGRNRNKNSKLEKLTIIFSVLIICIFTRLEIGKMGMEGGRSEGNYSFVGTLSLYKNAAVPDS